MLGSQDREHEILSPCSQPIIFHNNELNQGVLLNPRFRLFEVQTGASRNELSTEIAPLVAHQVVLVDSLTQASACDFCPPRSQHFSVSSILVVDGVQAVLRGQLRTNLVVKREFWGRKQLPQNLLALVNSLLNPVNAQLISFCPALVFRLYAAGNPNAYEAAEKKTADDRHFELAVEVFLRRHRMAEQLGKLNLILCCVAGE